MFQRFEAILWIFVFLRRPLLLSNRRFQQRSTSTEMFAQFFRIIVFACHGPDAKHREAELRLDQRDEAVKQKAIVPGKPVREQSRRRIMSTDVEEVNATTNDEQETHRTTKEPS